MKNKLLSLFLGLFIIIIFFNCGSKSKEKNKDEAETIFAVDTTKALKGEINDFIELNGDVKTKTEVSLYPDISGKLVNIVVKLGDYVYRNQTVAFVDPSKPGMDFNPSPVRSTINGNITELPIEIGSTVSSQSAIAKVGKLDELEIITYVAEKFISKMKLGLEAIIKTPAYPDKKFIAYISEMSPVVDPQSRMQEIKLKLKTNDKLLLSGMFVEIKIITEKKDDIVKIPYECLVKRYGNLFVFIVKRTGNNEGIVEKRVITPGIQIENKVEIIKGIQPDEEVVLRGQALLEDKSKVKIIGTYQPLTVQDNVE